MTHSPETLRLYNVDQQGRQLSLSLQRWQPKSSPGLRRGVVMTPILIAPGGFYDVCAQLRIDFEEARFIAERSPEVNAHKNAGRLLVREHPPSVETLAKEATEQTKIDAAKAKMDELNPADPPNAIPAGVNPVAAGLPPDTPRANTSPLDIVPPAELPTPTAIASEEPAAPIKAGVEAEAETEAELPDDPTPAALVEVEMPSMDWKLDKLRAYAEEYEVDLGKASSKSAILKKIQKAGGA